MAVYFGFENPQRLTYLKDVLDVLCFVPSQRKWCDLEDHTGVGIYFGHLSDSDVVNNDPPIVNLQLLGCDDIVPGTPKYDSLEVLAIMLQPRKIVNDCNQPVYSELPRLN